MRLSTSIRLAVLLTSIASVLTIGLLKLMTHSIDHERGLTQRQLEYRSLCHELASASDFLTNQARRYTIFGDKRHYDAFWNEVHRTRTRDRVVNRFKELEARREELALIDEAKRHSDELITTENKAMDAVRDGDFKLAQTLMFDENYDRKKGKIIGAIDQFQRTMNARIDAEVFGAQQRTRQYQGCVDTVIILYVVLVFGGLYVTFYRQMVMPLVAMTQAISRISAGHLDTEIPTPGTRNELNDLADAAEHFRATLVENVRLASNLKEHRDNLQEEVMEQTRKLLRNEERMRRTFHASPNGLAIESEDRGIMALNPQLSVMFGHDSEAIIGRPIEALIAEKCQDEYLSFRNTCETEATSFNITRELVGERADGSEFPLEIGLVQIDKTDDNQECLLMATIIDISERKKSEFAVRLKNEQLGRLNSELLEFAYSVSHDLKGPLLSMSGLLDFCRLDLDAGEYDEVRNNIARVQDLSKRLADRVASMLTLAQTDLHAGQWEEVSVSEHVENAWEALPHGDIALTTYFDGVDTILTVPARFDAVVENLLSNAIKYHDPAKENKIVQVTCWMQSDDFFLSVADNGVGIPQEHQEKVFRLFHRLAGEETEGTGLGLPLVKKNVLHLGGAISLDTSGEMTTFTIMLPQGDSVGTVDGIQNQLGTETDESPKALVLQE